MLALKCLLLILGVGLFSSSGIMVAHDIYIATRLRCLLEQTSRGKGNGRPKLQRRREATTQ